MRFMCVFLYLASLASVLEVQRIRAAIERDRQESLQTNLPDIWGKLILLLFICLFIFIYLCKKSLIINKVIKCPIVHRVQCRQDRWRSLQATIPLMWRKSGVDFTWPSSRGNDCSGLSLKGQDCGTICLSSALSHLYPLSHWQGM